MHVLVVTQYFWPENFRINDLCTELVARGHKVTVLTGVPNYPQGSVLPEFKQNPQEFLEYYGVEIIRVPILARGKVSSIKLILNYISYALSASTIGLFKLRKHKIDVVFVCQLSPITIALPAVLYRKIYQKPVVMWVLDLWPESLLSVGVIKSKFVLRLIGRLVSFIYKRCDLILGQSKAFYKGISLYCDDVKKIKYFPSWSEDVFLEKKYSPVALLKESNDDYFKIMFTGNIGEAQDFPAIVQSAEMIKVIDAKIKFFIVGDGRAVNWLQAAIRDKELEDYIYLLGRHPLEKMPIFYESADALLVSLKQSTVFSMTIPGKVQSYMASGKPILTMLSGEGSRVVDEASCGFTADSGDYEKLTSNIIQMSLLTVDELRDFGKKARQYSDKEFSRDKLVDQLEAWLENIKLEGR
ncbi:MAG: colanic acid biosynthesis glycosyl transferase WcaI [Thiomicrorhabdus sp.]|nr:MAG: colanic acid biosynthesis glycosyl transferase WcaI [Thiomicrorhabdus sp.]